VPNLNNLDDRAAAKAVLTDPETCAYCRGTLVAEGIEPFPHDRDVQSEVRCTDCNASFRIIYGITHVSVADRPEKGLLIGSRVRFLTKDECRKNRKMFKSSSDGYTTNESLYEITEAMFRSTKGKTFTVLDIEKHRNDPATITLKGLNMTDVTVEDWMLRPV